ncbi:MAG: hypothetical protein JRC56_01050 [Deltaproteobacteria bacterium]|nr:hypothetical protein [Deltaproteobacteria bacterium]MBW2619906.1 hypothetical protein [Deltaproteobacteria bacterium]
MPEKCRVGICGFDPMLVKGYIAQNMRAIWWHISDELFEEFDMKPGMKVKGKLLKLYAGTTGKEFAAPNEDFEWETSKEVGLVVLVPPDVVRAHELTAFMFADLLIESIDGKDVYPGEEKMSKKWWPDDKMKLDFTIDYIG